MTTHTTPWTSHRRATESLAVITHKTAEDRDVRTVAGRGELLFHIQVGGDGLRAVRAAYAANSQLRAEQAALAWTRSRWARDNRALYIIKTEIVD